MIINQKKVLITLILALSFQFLQAASFQKYFTKLMKFEGKGFGIHQAIWGNKDFTKNEAFRIHKRFYWDKYHADLFESQEVAEVFIDQIINTGEGKESVNIKAFEAILGVVQNGVLSPEDIKIANDFVFPEQIINPYVNYRLSYYRSRKNFKKYPGWITRAKSFMVADDEGKLLADYLVLPKMLIKEEEHDIVELFKKELLVKK
ncbi:glycosyl hydrolase 108 family protein [Emticicia sp.]|uniref:glycosyl hydrolase 108 family protein n=1 Tax=Emticicia sp. TaxID=1930953 RepID=UPI0037507C86